MRGPSLRQSLLDGKKLVGLFIKLHDPAVVEALAASPLDFVILDSEHGTQGRDEINRIVQVARSRGLPILVRVPDSGTAAIQQAISVGATGVLVPHISSSEEAKQVVSFARGAAIERAYAGMGRTSNLRRRAWGDVKAELDANIVLLLQIDDRAGLESATAIAAVEGVDAVFIGSLSLALSLGIEVGSRQATAAMKMVCAACEAAGRRVGIHLQEPAALPKWEKLGVSFFAAGNDCSLLLEAAERVCAAFGVARSPMAA